MILSAPRTALKAALLASGMRQVELAQKVGVHESVISGLCRGWRVPPEDLKIKIARELGLPKEAVFPAERRP